MTESMWRRLFHTYKSDFLLNISTLKIFALDRLVGPVQLPGNTKIGEEDDQTGEECAENGQSHNKGGVVYGLPIASPVYRAGKSKWLGSIAAPAQQRKQGPQASIQPDPTDDDTNGSPLELDTCAQADLKFSLSAIIIFFWFEYCRYTLVICTNQTIQYNSYMIFTLCSIRCNYRAVGTACLVEFASENGAKLL